ncbi:iron ABC transporter substrate-binding protein [Streptomyces sp. NPDC052396]|uniref:iron ABC transporter substrate-binding protein n=1 Tax=Streptomyces sp. NPDC052396 TaxID=3365689 RepID=UPI0037CCED17
MSVISRRSARRCAALSVMVSLSALALAGCGGSQDSGDSSAASGGSLKGQTITVYSGQHEQTVSALVKDFKARTGITAKVRSGDEAELANQLLTEGPASPADVFFAENPPALTTLEDKGLLAKTDTPTLSAVPAEDSSAKGDWVGVSAREAAFVYDTGKLKGSQVPQSVKDLADPAWKGKLGVAPSETDFTPIVTRMIKSLGKDGAKSWLEGLKANSKVYGSNEDLVAAVNRGEVEGGVIDHYYWYRLRDEQGAAKTRSALGYFKQGDPGALVDVSGAAALSHSKHKAAAQAFLSYLVSKPAQQIIAGSESYEYPLLAGVKNTKVSRALADSGPVARAAELGDGKDALDLLKSTGLL